MTSASASSAAVAAVAALVGGCSEKARRELPALGATLGADLRVGHLVGRLHGRPVRDRALDATSSARRSSPADPTAARKASYADVIPGPGTALLNLTKAINGCMLNALQSFGVPNPEQLAEARRATSRSVGRIDPVADVKDDRIYLFSGKDDHTVVPAIVGSARRFYEALGVPADHILYVADIPAGHALRHRGQGPGVRLHRQALHRRLRLRPGRGAAGADLRDVEAARRCSRPAPSSCSTSARSHASSSNHGLSDDGHRLRAAARAPRSAAAACTSPSTAAGRTARSSATPSRAIRAIARWADTNTLIVLFPQTATTPLNPQGCWDWWGYTGAST